MGMGTTGPRGAGAASGVLRAPGWAGMQRRVVAILRGWVMVRWGGGLCLGELGEMEVKIGR